ncbi:hypothetical protein CBS147482_6819 [Aspergillus niger]|nr:hypothetical protein CBS133816_4559 [Aspergillus niger]KAI2978240.1 hypothetical protein CBS147324_1589 [Aspergillus niger]KAI3001494.1 hypothetical protein CBS147482_6819 [Aspergillus niger]
MSHDKVDPRGIWRRAYELLKEDNEALVHEYEEKIQSAKDQIKLNGKEKLSPGIYPDKVHGMLSLTNEMIQQEEHKQTWNQSVTMAVQIVTSMKDIVAQAMKNSPEGSLAWAGLCLILPVFLNPVQQRSENVEGLSKVIHRISYYPSYAVWLMNHHSPGPDETWNVLEGQIVLLYKMLIQYIAKSVCQYYHVDSTTNKVKQLLKDTLKWDSWTTMIDDMQRLELEIQGKAQDLNLIASRNLLASQQQLELNNHMEQYLREIRDALALTLSSPGCQASGVKEIYTQRGPLVPFLRDKESFVGREVCFQQINEGFEQSTRIALCGLGGAGKSRIALEYVYRMREQDPHLCIFWVFAASRSSLQSSYETIRREIPPEYIRTLQFSLRTGVAGNVDTERETISLVTQWLRSDQISRWLLVVDNADDLTFVDPTHPEESHLMNLIPSASNGKVLITSRNGRVAEELVGFANRVVRVERMTMTEATTLFRSMLPNDTSPEADIEKLADAIMCLPLAIKQACAYIRATYTTKSLLEENFGDITRRADVPNAVILTWQMSFEKMKQQVPVTDASEILAFMAMCKDPSTKRVNVDELLSILVHVADDLDREVIVIFDGIDEVQSTANLEGIFRMIDSLLNHRRFRLLVSSRAVGYMEERQWPQRMLKIELSLETFTVIGWTTAIPHMIQQVGFDQIITIINKDPAGSTSWMYDAVFASMRIGQRRYVERIFCWLAYSLRSLTSGEVLEAINSDFNTSFDESELTAMCHPLAVPAFNGETRVIQFMHKRVESHVLQLHTSTATGEADANWIIISSCLRCILRYGPEVATETINELPSQFLMYAAKYWPKHLQSCISPSVAVKETDIPDEARDYMRQLFDLNSSQAFLGWLRLFDPMNPTRGSQLEAALDDFPPQAAYIAELGLPPEILLLTPNKTMPAAQPIMPIRRRKGWKEKAGAFWARRHFLTD